MKQYSVLKHVDKAAGGTRLQQQASSQQGLPLVKNVAEDGVEKRSVKGALPHITQAFQCVPGHSSVIWNGQRRSRDHGKTFNV